MRIRPLSLLLAPLWLLAGLYILASCNAPATGPSAVVVPSSSGGIATASVITVVPAVTSQPGGIPNVTVPPAPSAEPPTPLPTLASASLTPTELKYRILDQFPNFFYCDPDYYPVARSDEGEVAKERFPELQNDQEEFQAILALNHLSGMTTFTDGQKLLIYREHKKLAALHFQLIADQYQFQLTTGGDQAYNIQGTIDGSGHINVQEKTAAFATCPICLAAHTRIDTPRGAVMVEEIKPGDVVWTVDASGMRVAAPVTQVARVPVSLGHILVHVVLDDGRELWASPGHPTADGRRLVQLQPGDRLDGSWVISAEQVAYDGMATYDVLPAGPTGYYWADGILMGSTLKP
ncbi:MAG TPA: Hint domain-containing protein [Anaerolineales bacterium]|nr:Hint domain-containing protein [Anaerolineales bacterium]